ncbi:MAG: DNA-binding protein [Terriglobia bacterium]
MSYTVGKAARATGRSKPTISRAIKSGVISAVRNENGSYTIDPAELHRVFPPVTSAHNGDDDPKETETPALKRENKLLRERIASQDEAITDLRQRLDRAEEERRQAQAQVVILLTDQRSPSRRRQWWPFGRAG